MHCSHRPANSYGFNWVSSWHLSLSHPAREACWEEIGIRNESRGHGWQGPFKCCNSKIHTEAQTQFWRVAQKKQKCQSYRWVEKAQFSIISSYINQERNGRFYEIKIWAFLLWILYWELCLCGLETLRLRNLRCLWSVGCRPWTSVTLCECVMVSGKSELCWDDVTLVRRWMAHQSEWVCEWVLRVCMLCLHDCEVSVCEHSPSAWASLYAWWAGVCDCGCVCWDVTGCWTGSMHVALHHWLYQVRAALICLSHIWDPAVPSPFSWCPCQSKFQRYCCPADSRRKHACMCIWRFLPTEQLLWCSSCASSHVCQCGSWVAELVGIWQLGVTENSCSIILESRMNDL